MSAGLVGTAISNGLIAIRQKIDPAFEPQNALPDVRLNAACEPPPAVRRHGRDEGRLCSSAQLDALLALIW